MSQNMWLQPATIPNHNIPQTNSWKESFMNFREMIGNCVQLKELTNFMFIKWI